jgi:pRiA4b ORF-3-like protein
MARAKRSITPVVYQIKVILKGSKPPIWRRIQVPSDTTLARLHRILQRVMGWEDYHLYQFVVAGMEYSDPRVAGGDGGRRRPEGEQIPRSSRRNPLPMKRINWSLLMRHEYLACALV